MNFIQFGPFWLRYQIVAKKLKVSPVLFAVWHVPLCKLVAELEVLAFGALRRKPLPEEGTPFLW